MQSRASECDTQAATLADVVSKMDTLLANLQAEWEGKASEAYAERYNAEFKPGLQRTQAMLEEIARALRQQAENMREIDAAQANAIRG